MEEKKRRNGPLDLVTWLLRTGAPAALHGTGLGLVAGLLEEQEGVFDAKSARSALEVVHHARASVEVLGRVVNNEKMGDAGRAVEDALEVLLLADGAVVAALANALGAGAKTGDLIQDACLRVQTIAGRWGKDVPPPTMPCPTESEREKPTAPSRRGGSRKGAPSSVGHGRLKP